VKSQKIECDTYLISDDTNLNIPILQSELPFAFVINTKLETNSFFTIKKSSSNINMPYLNKMVKILQL